MEGYYAQKKYLKKILTQEDETKYINLAVQGDVDAKKILFEHNLRLVKKVMQTYFAYLTELEKEDAFQVGCIGLWNAINKYDPEFDTKLSTYAYNSIYFEITKNQKYNNLLSVPYSLQILHRKIYAIKQEYEKKGLNISEQELAKILNVSEAEVLLAIKSMYKLSSLSEPIKSKNEDVVLGDLIADNSESAEDKIDKNHLEEEIIKIINKLDVKEQLVIKWLFGFDCEQKSQKEIQNILNLSYYQFKELKKRSINKLKNYLLNNELIYSIGEISSRNKNYDFITKPIEELFNFFPQYSKEEILNAIESLNDNNRKLIKIVYCLNEEQYTSMEEKQRKIDMITKNYLVRMEQIKNYLNNILEKGPIKRISFYDYFKEYTEEEVYEAIEKLPRDKKDLIELKYGLNGKNICINKELEEIFNINEETLRKRIQRIRKEIKDILFRQVNKTEDVQVAEKALKKIYTNF